MHIVEQISTGQGSSDRLNEKLDLAGYPPIASGRAAELARVAGRSRPAARRWIHENVFPDADIEKIAEDIIMRTDRPDVPANKLCGFIRYGEDVVKDPFLQEGIKLSTINSLLLFDLYKAIDGMELKLGIDTATINQNELAKSYDLITMYVSETRTIDLEFIENNLKNL